MTIRGFFPVPSVIFAFLSALDDADGLAVGGRAWGPGEAEPTLYSPHPPEGCAAGSGNGMLSLALSPAGGRPTGGTFATRFHARPRTRSPQRRRPPGRS